MFFLTLCLPSLESLSRLLYLPNCFYELLRNFPQLYLIQGGKRSVLLQMNKTSIPKDHEQNLHI